MKKIILFLIITLLAFQAQATELEEINHLLKFIKNSNCIFIRNGKDHRTKEAIKHIIKKYNYYRKKIDSAEKFIELAASKSGLTGRSYLVKCANYEPIKSKNWLLEELKKIRG